MWDAFGSQIPRGEVLGIELVWELGKATYSEKLSTDWSRSTPEEDEATFARLELVGDFWRLTETS